MPGLLDGHQHAVPGIGGHIEVGQDQVLQSAEHIHPGFEEAALELEASPNLAAVGMDLDEVVKCAKGEGVGAGVGDRGLADNTRLSKL